MEKTKTSTDEVIYRHEDGNYSSPSIFKTEKNKIGISVGGSVHIKDVREWHELANKDCVSNQDNDFKFAVGDLVLHKTQTNNYGSDKPMLVVGRGNMEFEGGSENVYSVSGLSENRSRCGGFISEVELKEYPNPKPPTKELKTN